MEAIYEMQNFTVLEQVRTGSYLKDEEQSWPMMLLIARDVNLRVYRRDQGGVSGTLVISADIGLSVWYRLPENLNIF